MVFAMAMPAMASEQPKKPDRNQIEITSTPGHTYEAYQIFTGDVAYEGDDSNVRDNNILSNIKWSEDVNRDDDFATDIGAVISDYYPSKGEDDLFDALDAEKVAKALGNDLPAEAATAFAEAIAPYLTTVATTGETGKDGKCTLVVAPGYYLIKDKDDSLVDEAGNPLHEAYTAFILEVVGDRNVKAKSSTPSVDKEVSDGTYDAPTWGETANHEIGEKFQIKLDATIPADAAFAQYESYKLVFHDTMSKGVAYDGNVKVVIKYDSVDPIEIPVKAEGVAGYTVTTSDPVDGTAESTLTLIIEDIIPFLKDTVVDGAHTVWGTKTITVEVTYDAHLTSDAAIARDGVEGAYNNNKVTLDFSNNPNAGGEEETGTTPPDTVVVFTYELPNKKVDETGATALAGAEFQLYKTDPDVKEPKGTPVELKKGADNKYYIATPEEIAADEGKGPEEKTLTNTIVTDNTGMFNIEGLDEGTYYLKETKAPDGYNLLEKALVIVVTATTEETVDGEAKTVYQITIDGTELNKTNPDGTYTVGGNDIKNQKGTTLPETGGIGTTIFYVVGSVLVLGAVILLVTKRRMKSE